MLWTFLSIANVFKNNRTAISLEYFEMASPEMAREATRNFRDFMRLYNHLTEQCFNTCVAELGFRNLSAVEEDCVSHCADKTIRLNHRTMEVFMELQPAMMEKRRLEAEAAMALVEENQSETGHEDGSSEASAAAAATGT